MPWLICTWVASYNLNIGNNSQQNANYSLLSDYSSMSYVIWRHFSVIIIFDIELYILLCFLRRQWVREEDLAKDLKLHAKQLRRVLRFLEEEKLLTRDHRKEVSYCMFGLALFLVFKQCIAYFSVLYSIAVCIEIWHGQCLKLLGKKSLGMLKRVMPYLDTS